MTLSGQTIFLVKVDDFIIGKFFDKQEAITEAKSYNFELTRGLNKAKLYKAIIK